MLRIGSIVWGVRDVPRAIAFWSAALSYRPLREPSPDWAILVRQAGPGPQLAITVVTSEADDHQRHHLDLYADDAVLEIEPLLRRGASIGDTRRETTDATMTSAADRPERAAHGSSRARSVSRSAADI
jgi:hypothetical protein